MSDTLDHLPVGATARITRLQGGHGFQSRIGHLGLEVGQVLHKTRQESSGPILVELESSTIAIGRGLAHRIVVEALADGN